MDQVWMWIGFNAFVLILLALDLGVFHRKAHAVSWREAAVWSVVWVTLALCFNLVVYRFMGRQAAVEYFTGYLIEKSLSVDNIFVFVLVFSYFRVPPKYQHRVLFWGILGALVMRGTMIGAGAYLIERFHWIIYVFGAFLIFTGFRMATQTEHEVHPEANPILRVLRRLLPLTNVYHDAKFLIREADAKGRMRLVATPLLVVLVVVETTDLIFALDSIPAIFAITRDPFLVYTSNVFAILGLRALYFLLAGVVHKFHYLKLGLAVILVYVGVKMLLTETVEIPVPASLGVIAFVLVTSVVASLLFPKKVEAFTPAEHDPLQPVPEPAKAPIDPSPEGVEPERRDD